MDSEYIQKVLGGDTQAYRYFIEKYRDMAFSLAISIVKNSNIAEEVTQDAFLKAYNALGKFEQRSKFSTWLYKIVRNEGLKRIQKKDLRYTDDVSELNDISLSEVNHAIARLSETDQKYYINMVLDKMIPNDSMVLRLFYLNEQSLIEISEITGFSGTKIKTILHRARKRFYTLLQLELKHEIKSIL